MCLFFFTAKKNQKARWITKCFLLFYASSFNFMILSWFPHLKKATKCSLARLLFLFSFFCTKNTAFSSFIACIWGARFHNRLTLFSLGYFVFFSSLTRYKVSWQLTLLKFHSQINVNVSTHHIHRCLLFFDCIKQQVKNPNNCVFGVGLWYHRPTFRKSNAKAKIYLLPLL